MKLRQDNDTWDDGWRIMSAGELASAEIIESGEMLYRRARKHSDLSRNGRSLKG